MRGETWIGRISVAVAVTCVTAVTVTAVALAVPSVQTIVMGEFGSAPSPPPSYVVGQAVDLRADILQQAPNTVAIFFRPDCGACERLKPFLSRLSARSHGTLRVVAITGVANPEDSLAFAKQIGLDASRLVTMDLKTLRLKRVPTVVLVDRHGTIHAAIEGIPSSRQEEDLLRMVTPLSQGR